MTTPSEMPREPQRTRTTFTRSLVAGVSVVALLAGVGLTQFAQAVPQQLTEQVQPQRYGLPDFSPLVERVKPAVLSVQVEINPAMRTAADEDDDQQSPGENPFKGTPFERFFGPNGGNGPHGFWGPPWRSRSGAGAEVARQRLFHLG